MRASVSFIAGALLSLINYGVTVWSVRSLVKGADHDPEGVPSGGEGPSRFFFVLKYPVLLVLIGLILLKTPVQPGPFVAGFLSILFVLLLRNLIQK